MAMYSLLRNEPRPTEEQIKEAVQGNLCRCTGYRPILEAFYSFATGHNGDLKIVENGCGMGDQCCKLKGGSGCGGGGEPTRLVDFSSSPPYDSSQELIFPPELTMKHTELRSFAMQHPSTLWLQPAHLRDLLALKRLHPHARLVSGNSELAVERKFRFIDLPIVINPRQAEGRGEGREGVVEVVELHEARLDTEMGAYLGTGLSLTQMDEKIVHFAASLPNYARGVFDEVHSMMQWFAGKHVRNVASIAGNIATASPISDLNPIWMASAARVVLESEARGEREVTIDDNFFIGYRKTTIAGDEVVKGVWVPLTKENEIMTAYKQAARREDDIAIVTGAFCTLLDPSSFSVVNTRLSFGGMAPTTLLLVDVMEAARGRRWDSSLLEGVSQHLSSSLILPPGVPGGMPRYRLSLALSFFYKHYLEVARRMNITEIPYRMESTRAGDSILDGLFSSQVFQQVSAGQPSWDAVGRPIPHASGQKHTTGEAVYSGDVKVPDCLHAAFVLSRIASGTLVSMDPSAALSMEGVVAFFDASDIPIKSALLGYAMDTEVFVSEKIKYNGQPLGMVVAVDHETARRGANAVVVDASPSTPVVTIEDALEANSFLCDDLFVHSSMKDGKSPRVVTDWSSYENVVSGQIRIGGQEHFYLETHNSLVIPHEDNELEIIASTQCVADIQKEIGRVLGVPRNKIRVSVRRIGGGFGGKESSGPLSAVPAAIAAMKLRKPVRIVLERFDDMAITGNRHPFRFDYKVAVSSSGHLLDMDIVAINNCGHSVDLSIGVMQRCLVHVENVYKFDNIDARGRHAKTNLASNTAYRGFGAPQAMFATESIMRHVAEEMNFDLDLFREQNMYLDDDETFYGNKLSPCNVRRCWNECREASEYDQRRKDVQEFNQKNRFRKRGIQLMPTKFSIGFGAKHLNQASALLLVYTDGSVLISHGGMEMGQGLHTKMIQVASRCLGIDASRIHIQDAATDKVPNAGPTAASMGSDLNGLAVQDACEQLNSRLAPIKAEMPEGDWDSWVAAAHMRMISLSATGHSIVPCEPVDFSTGAGAEMFQYAVYGTACCEVEVDCLTGDHYLLRTDIVMDVGDSLNPAVDIGQIEGAFVQGYGLYTMEEVKVRPWGIRLSRGPGAYKIPSADDAPRQFHVRLLKKSSNEGTIFSSKAIGEPPLFLGACVLFAIRDAVKAFREASGRRGYFRFDSPATAERIRMACEDDITNMVPHLPKEPGAYEPWVVDL